MTNLQVRSLVLYTGSLAFPKVKKGVVICWLLLLLSCWWWMYDDWSFF